MYVQDDDAIKTVSGAPYLTPRPSCAPHLMEVPVAGSAMPAVDIGELLWWNGFGEPDLRRDLISDSERLMVLSEIGIAPRQDLHIWLKLSVGWELHESPCRKRETSTK